MIFYRPVFAVRSEASPDWWPDASENLRLALIREHSHPEMPLAAPPRSFEIEETEFLVTRHKLLKRLETLGAISGDLRPMPIGEVPCDVVHVWEHTVAFAGCGWCVESGVVVDGPRADINRCTNRHRTAETFGQVLSWPRETVQLRSAPELVVGARAQS
jgi:hypothetical protein